MVPGAGRFAHPATKATPPTPSAVTAVRRENGCSSLDEVKLPPTRDETSMFERKDSETDQAARNDHERLLNFLELHDDEQRYQANCGGGQIKQRATAEHERRTTDGACCRSGHSCHERCDLKILCNAPK